MQITDLYETRITCTTYNANIDSTDTVIIVKLVDFNGNAVTNKNVTLTCDKGYFNKKGSTSISGTSTKSITDKTDSNGTISATWTASEWGLCTFSANNSKIQVKVGGWKTYYSDSYYTVKYNEDLVYYSFNFTTGSGTSIPSNSWWVGGVNVLQDEWIRPANNVFFVVANMAYALIRKDDGKINVKALSGTISGELSGEVIYKRR